MRPRSPEPDRSNSLYRFILLYPSPLSLALSLSFALSLLSIHCAPYLACPMPLRASSCIGAGAQRSVRMETLLLLLSMPRHVFDQRNWRSHERHAWRIADRGHVAAVLAQYLCDGPLSCVGMMDEELDHLDALGAALDDPVVIESSDDGAGSHVEFAALAEARDLSLLERLGAEAPAVADDFAADLDAIEGLGRRHQPPLKRTFAQRSADSAAHARAALREKRDKAKQARLEESIAEQSEQLARVGEHFPAVGRACGILPQKRGAAAGSSADGAQMPEGRAVALIRAAFEPSSVPRGLGVKHERLVCFAADLVTTLQQQGLMSMLHRAALLRSSCDDPSFAHVVIVCYSHESDATSQGMAQHVIQRIGRASRRRLQTEIINQRGSFRISLRRVSRETGEVVASADLQQAWHSMSTAVLEKTAPFVLCALQRGMAFDLGGPLWPAWRKALEASVDCLVVDQRTDKGSNNAPALRHLAAQVLEATPVICDMSVCELHVLSGLRSSIPSLKHDIGKMYSLANICKVASHHYGLVSSIEHLCHSIVRRLVQRPPDEARDLERLADALFDFGALHHQRSGNRESFLLGDLRALSAVPLCSAPGQSALHQVRVHFCWDEETQQGCCQSEEQAAEKATTAHVNFFASAAIEDVSMARFKNVAKVRKKLVLGMANDRLYLSALRFASARVVDPSAPMVPEIPKPADAEPEEAGADEGALVHTHRTRCARLCQWLSSREFYFRLPIGEVVQSFIEKLEYAVFGRDRKSVDLGRMLDVDSSPIGECLGSYWELLNVWEARKDGVWRVLVLSGWTDFKAQDVRLKARGEVLHLAAGVHLHFDLKYSSLPYSLFRLMSPKVDESVKRQLCEHLRLALPCNVPLFAAGFRQRFPLESDMMSPAALAVLEGWSAQKDFSTKASEMGHASERRALSSSGAPGKSFLHHARRDILQRSRTDHIARSGKDPLAKLPMRRAGSGKPPQSCLEAPVAPDPFEEVLPGETLQSVVDRAVSAEALQQIAGLPGPQRHAALPHPRGGALPPALPPPPPPAPHIASSSSAAIAVVASGVSASPGGAASSSSPPRRKASGSGGSIYQTHLNRVRMEFKLGAGDRKLTPAEREAATQSARDRWASMEEDEREALGIVYKAQVRRRQEGGASSADQLVPAPLPAYTSHWGMSSPMSPIKPAKFCEATGGVVGGRAGGALVRRVCLVV